MSRRVALALTAALTTFLILITGALAWGVRSRGGSSPTPTPAVDAPVRGDFRALPQGVQAGDQEVIPAEEAARIAAAYVGGAAVREVELERERGVEAYEVKLDGAKVYVDAYTGEVLYAKREGYHKREEHEEHEGHEEWEDD